MTAEVSKQGDEDEDVDISRVGDEGVDVNYRYRNGSGRRKKNIFPLLYRIHETI